MANESEREHRIGCHFTTVAEAAASGIFTFMTHIDSMRRCLDCGEFGFQQSAVRLSKLWLIYIQLAK